MGTGNKLLSKKNGAEVRTSAFVLLLNFGTFTELLRLPYHRHLPEMFIAIMNYWLKKLSKLTATFPFALLLDITKTDNHEAIRLGSL